MDIQSCVVGCITGALITLVFMTWREQKVSARLVVDDALLKQINDEMVMAWLNHNDLVVMPKGQDFKWPHEVRRD